MKTPPNRIAAIALAVLVLACIGAWWWTRPEGARPRGSAAVPDAAPPTTGRFNGHRVAAASVGAAGRSKAAEKCGEAMATALSDHALSLKERNDANSQLAYGLALPFTVYEQLQREGSVARDPKQIEYLFEQQGRESRQAFSRALTLAPDNRDVVWVAASHCGADMACSGMQQALLKAESDNAAAWLMEMSRAGMRNDPVAAERAFERAANATGYDRHAGANHLAMLDAFAEVKVPEACRAPGVQAELRRDFPGTGALEATDFVLVWSMATTQMPAFTGIYQRCKPTDAEPLDRKRRVACGRILEKMVASDTLIEHSIALTLLVQLAGDGPDAGQWRDRYRQHLWMQSQMTDLALQAPQATSAIRQLTMEDYIFDEMPAIQAALQASGRWPAPADWLPSDEHARSLVLAGRPPPKPGR